MTRLAILLATFGYVGHFPIAPGTAGSAAALVLYAALRYSQASPIADLAVIVLLFAAGCWAGTVAERHYGRTGSRCAEIRDCELRAVRKKQRDPAAANGPKRTKPRREPCGQTVKLSIRVLAALEDQRHPHGMGGGDLFQPTGQSQISSPSMSLVASSSLLAFS